jgi:2EXR family
MDPITAMDVQQNDSGSYCGAFINVETQISAAFELKQTEAIDPKDEFVRIEARYAEGSGNLIVSDNGLLAKFDKSPRLPAELRLMIWREALPGPRLVDGIFDFKDNYTRFGTRPLYCKSRTPPPAILHVLSRVPRRSLEEV